MISKANGQNTHKHTEWPSITEGSQTSTRLPGPDFCLFFFSSNLFSYCFPFYKCAHSSWDVQTSCGDVRHDRCLFCPAHGCKHIKDSRKSLFQKKIPPQSDDADIRQLHCFSITSSAQLFNCSNALD